MQNELEVQQGTEVRDGVQIQYEIDKQLLSFWISDTIPVSRCQLFFQIICGNAITSWWTGSDFDRAEEGI